MMMTQLRLLLMRMLRTMRKVASAVLRQVQSRQRLECTIQSWLELHSVIADFPSVLPRLKACFTQKVCCSLVAAREQELPRLHLLPMLGLPFLHRWTLHCSLTTLKQQERVRRRHHEQHPPCWQNCWSTRSDRPSLNVQGTPTSAWPLQRLLRLHGALERSRAKWLNEASPTCTLCTLLGAQG